MPDNVLRAIREAGVVGAGGAGFPTHVKFGNKAGCVIVNGAECEPLLRVDQQLLLYRSKELLTGLTALLDSVDANRGIIALKAKYTEAIAQLSSTVTDPRVEIFRLGDFYPAGDEQVLVREITGRSVPEAGIPLNLDCIVANVETVLNVAAALEGQPVVETWLTVTGSVTEPLTCKVPVGTPIQEVLSLAGIRQEPGLAVLEGGPMMGRLVSDWNTPVTKTTKGLIVLAANHGLIKARQALPEQILRRARSVCIQCERCSQMCPRNLVGHSIRPHRIMRMLAYAREDWEMAKSVLLCCGCGVCDYVCPMGLFPKYLNILLKAELGKAGISYPGKGLEPQALSHRDYRKIPVKRLVSGLGLKPYDRPAPVRELSIKPRRVTILFKQHTGEPSVPLVQVGNPVKQGQVIGEIPETKLGARIHASIDGIVVEQNVTHVVIEAVG